MEGRLEQETTTPGRGTAESAEWFRSKLGELKMSQANLARYMLAHGDDRQLTTILRSLSRMASGDARVSGEMRVLLSMLETVFNQDERIERLTVEINLRSRREADANAVSQTR